jgi:hypothetical protein
MHLTRVAGDGYDPHARKILRRLFKPTSRRADAVGVELHGEDE